MEKLDKAYEAVDLLKSIDIPISPEQKAIISRLEKDYVREEIIPLFEQELQSMVGKMRNKFELEVTYSKENGVDISLVDRPKIQPQIFASEQPAKRQRKYIIRVLFPDNHVSCNKTVWETLMDVIRYAGPSRVQQLGITIMGGNLVSNKLHENERYRVGQKDVGNGLYVCTYSSTDTKYEEIRRINKELGLGLKIEKVML